MKTAILSVICEGQEYRCEETTIPAFENYPETRTRTIWYNRNGGSISSETAQRLLEKKSAEIAEKALQLRLFPIP